LRNTNNPDCINSAIDVLKKCITGREGEKSDTAEGPLLCALSNALNCLQPAPQTLAVLIATLNANLDQALCDADSKQTGPKLTDIDTKRQPEVALLDIHANSAQCSEVRGRYPKRPCAELPNFVDQNEGSQLRPSAQATFRTMAQAALSKTQWRLAQWERHRPICGPLALHLGHARVDAVMNFLEGLRAPALLMDAAGKVLRVNAAANQLLCSEFQILQGELRVSHRAAWSQIANALRRIPNEGEARILGPFWVPSRAGCPLILRLIRVSAFGANPFSQGAVIILVTDPDSRRASLPDEIFRIFGLTTAEIHLARILCSGDDLTRAAERLRITSETARSRLKSIFAKTNTHKQGALVALFSRIGGTF